MPRLILDPDEHDRVTTRRLRDESIADVTLRFDDAGRTEQDLDAEDAEAFADAYDDLRLLEETDEAGIDDVGELLAGTVDDIRAAVQAGEYDDRLDELTQREQEGDGRVGVQEAVEARQGELADSEGDR